MAAVAVLASAACGAPGSGPGRTTGSSSSSTAHRTGASTPVSTVPSFPQVLVGVTTGGALESLDPSSGAVVRTLASGVVGDEVSVTPDGSTVYFEQAAGCLDQIESVPVAGGLPTMVADGNHPAVSPNGAELAYARQPALTGASCQGSQNDLSSDALVVRQLSTGSETTYPMSPQLAAQGLPMPIDHISWSPDNRRLALSLAAPEDNEGWQLSIVDSQATTFYTAGQPVPLSGSDTSSSYYREGVFLPDGNLFVNRVCCAGLPVAVNSTLLLEVDPTSGATLHQVAIGFTNKDHTSLDADSSGHWLLYLSGTDLLVSRDGARPTTWTGSLMAAAW